MFKKEFKYYKSRCVPPNYDCILDFHLWNNGLYEKVVQRQPQIPSKDSCCSKYGLIESREWKILEFRDKPGLIFIPNPFTREGQQFWVEKCLKEYTKKPSRLNLDPFQEPYHGEDFWKIIENDKENGVRLLNKLRWATLGYHHNWDTKEYTDTAHDEFPQDLADLSKIIVQVLGDPASASYRAEAAIVNFYHLDSTLSGHRDVSEPNKTSPLLSISFGQSAIFLVGGDTLDDPVTAMYIHSGDIVVMSGPARHYYHGIPRIILNNEKPWAGGGDWEYTACARYLDKSRINVNIRQVLPPDNDSIKR